MFPARWLLGLAAALAMLMLAAPARAEFGYLTEFGQGAGPDEQLNVPRAAVVDLAGSLYVSDTNNNRVRKSDSNGTFIAYFGPGAGAGELSLPEGLAVDAQNNLYVVDTGHARVAKFSSGGRYLGQFGPDAGGPGVNPLGTPSGVAVTKDGRVLVTDTTSDSLIAFAPDGTRTSGGRFFGIGAAPRGVALTGSDLVVVALQGSSQIQSWQLDSSALGTTLITIYDHPIGVAADPGGDIWIADTGHGRVLKMSPNGGAFTSYVSASPNAAVDPTDEDKRIFTSPEFIAVDCRGNLYVPDSGQNRVEKYGDPAVAPPPCAPPPVSVGETFDLEIAGIEVTQATQRLDADVDAVRDLPAGGVARYDGVTLQQGKRTIVRVYANAIQGPPGGLTGVPVVLRAFRNGRPLDPGVLLPEGGPSVIVPRPGPVGVAQRADPLGAFTFTVPFEWANGPLTLEAEVNPAGFNPAVGGCATPECEVNDRRRLAVDFHPTANILTLPVLLSAGGDKRPRDANKAFDRVRRVLPVGIDVPPFRAVIDVTDIVTADTINEESCFLVFCDESSRPVTGDDKRTLALQRLIEWADDVEPRSRYYVVGLQPGTLGSIQKGVVGSESQAVAVMDVARPLQGMAHEFVHGLGVAHASKACGGGAGDQIGEDWAPDQLGFLQGIGLDPAPGSGGARGPYNIIAAPVQAPAGVKGKDGAPPDEAYDLMSYCVSSSNPEYNTWISPRNWERAANFLRPGQASRQETAAGPTAAAAAAHATGRHVALSGYVLPSGQAVVTRAQRVDGAPRANAPSGPITVIAFNAAGAELSRATARVSATSEGASGTTLTFSAELPDGAVARVEVQRDGVKVADVARSPVAPKLTLLAPRAGDVLGRSGTVRVRWRAPDRDAKAQVRIQVEYSTDGRTFRRIYDGPDRGAATLPSRLFSTATRARVRVRASDGLNESVVTSPALRSLGAAPAVTLLAPAAGAVRADAAVIAEGTAYDDTGARLAGRSLRWMIGDRILARGPRATLLGLPSGRPLLKLVARDRRGRETTTSVRLRVRPVKPFFLLLKAPARVSKRATGVRVRVASTVAAVLRAGGRAVAVDRRTQLVTIPLRPGARPATLTLSLRSGGLKTDAKITVARR